MTLSQQTHTHEDYLQATRSAVVGRAIDRHTIDPDQVAKLSHTKLMYGIGNGGYRGVCHFEAWENGVGRVDAIEIAASGEESWVQLAGTTIHELAHVLAGKGAGHDKAWREACERLGLYRAKAAGQQYRLAQLDPIIREAVYELARTLGDGRPEFRTYGFSVGTLVALVRGCSQGVGTRGGTSRGKGSGSRLRLYECQGCEKRQKVRVASDDFDATHNVCGTAFARVER